MRRRKCGGTFANMYITPSATMMLATWLEMRGTLWLEPLNIVARPTPINSSSTTSNWVSRWAVSSRVKRLITGTGRSFVGFERGRLLAEQIIIEHLARDGGGGARAEAGVFHQHGERQFRLVGRRICDEQRMVAMALLHAALDIFFSLLNRDDLGSPGLAGAYVRCSRERARAGAFLVDADQRLLDHRQVLGLQLQCALGLGLDHGAF